MLWCLLIQEQKKKEEINNIYSFKGFIYNPKSEKVGTVWKTQIKKESSDF